MPIFLDLQTRLDAKSAEDAAKAVTKTFIDAGNDINKTFGGVLSKMFEGLDGSKARAELKSVQDEYAKTARAAADAGRVMARANEDAAASIRRTTEVNTRYGEASSQTARALAMQHDKQALATVATLDAAAAADKAAAAQKGVAEASTGAGSSALSMNTSMIVAAGGAVALGAAAFETGKKLFDMGEQWADMSDKITFTTGKIGADAAAMTDQIAKIGDKTAAPLGNIADVYTQLTRLKDLQGSTLDDLTKHVADYDQMATRAGADPMNLGLFTRIMQEFHVPADQMRNDLNALVGAAQDGQVPFNELLQTVQTAGPTADLAGLSFGQLTNVLAVLDASGVDVDKTMQGLRIGLGTLAKDSPALQKLIKFTPDENELQRLKDVIQKIQQLHASNQDIAADALGATVFGRSWTAIADDIEKGKLNVDDLNTSASVFGDKIGDMRTATMRFRDDWQEVKNKVTDALKPLSTDVFKELNDGLEELGDWVQQHGDGVNRFFSDLGNTLAWVNPLTWITKAFPDPTPPEHKLGKGGMWQAFPGAPGRHFDYTKGGWVDDAGNVLSAPGTGSPDAGPPTAANINTTKPFNPIDLNPADKPPGAETYDQWISSQKAVQAAQNRLADTGEQLAAAQAKQKDLLAGGKATQEELNSNAEEIARAQRDNLEATQDLTIAQNKAVEDANKQAKTSKGCESSLDNYNPFEEATKGAKGGGLIPKLSSLLAAWAANEALGNPYGKLQAAKRGEDPSNPMYVADVNGEQGPGGAPSGMTIPQMLRQAVTGQAPGQAPGTGTPSAARTSSASLTGATAPAAGAPSSSKDQVASDIINAARARGLNEEQTLAALSTGILESGLGSNAMTNVPQNQSGTVVQGVFQQDSGYDKYGGRTNPANAATGFVDQFVARGGQNMDPYQGAVKVQVGTYGADYVRSFRPQALDYYNRLTAPGATASGQGYPFQHNLVADDGSPGDQDGQNPFGAFQNAQTGSMRTSPFFAAGPSRLSGLKPGAAAPSTPWFGGQPPAAASSAVSPTTDGPRPGSGLGKGFSPNIGSSIMSAAGPLGSMMPGAQQGAQLADRTAGYVGQLGGIAAEGLMSSLIPGSSVKGGLTSGWLGKIGGAIAGSHGSSKNTAGQTATPLDPKDKQQQDKGQGQPGGDTNHIGQQTNGVHVENMRVDNTQPGQDLNTQLQFASYAGYGSR